MTEPAAARADRPLAARLAERSPEAPRDCPACPRLAAFRDLHRALQPGWHNAPVASWGAERPRLVIVGLAPGLRGANRTGRPFTGDYAGDLLYATMLEYGFAVGRFEARPDDGLRLVDSAVTNAVRCVPPENRPTPDEIATCRAFLARRIEAFPDAIAILALGRIAHDSTVRALGRSPARVPFAHGAVHGLGSLRLYDSYHCSRYNTNTGVLTTDMFRAVFARIRGDLDSGAA